MAPKCHRFVRWRLLCERRFDRRRRRSSVMTLLCLTLALIVALGGPAYADTSAPVGTGGLMISQALPSGWDDPFLYTISCTGPANTFQTTIAGTASQIQSGIPAGSTCGVTSLPLHLKPSKWLKPTFSPKLPITIVAGTNVTVNVTQTPSPGFITIKEIAPSGSTALFEFTISCANPIFTVVRSVVGSGTVGSGRLPPTSTCAITQKTPSGLSAPVFNPPGPFGFHDDRSLKVAATNTLLPTGSLRIRKVLVGILGANDTFGFIVTCTNPSNTFSLGITGTGTATQSGIPVGSICKVKEDLAPGSPFVSSISPDSVVIGSGTTEVVTVTNTAKRSARTSKKAATPTVVLSKQLARTGVNVRTLFPLGFGLVVLGALMVLCSLRRPKPVLVGAIDSTSRKKRPPTVSDRRVSIYLLGRRPRDRGGP